MRPHLAKEEREKLAEIEIPDNIVGSIERFRNFDPDRIKDYELKNGYLYIYLDEIQRLESVREFRSTIELFHYEVERGKIPETEAFYQFSYEEDFQKMLFIVDRHLFKQDITAELIERSIVEDALKYQLYSRKEIGVNVIYIDHQTQQAFIDRFYPTKNELFEGFKQ